MSAPLKDFSFDQLHAARDKGDTLFRKRRITFIRTAIALPSQQMTDPSQSDHLKERVHPIQMLHIEKTDTPALYEKVTNGTKFQELCNTILRVDTAKLLHQIQLLLQDHQASMPSDVRDNIQIIAKYVVQFQKRIQMSLKTTFDECNEVSDVQEKARDALTKAFKDGFISYIMPALLEGLKTTPSYYTAIIGFVNDFLEQYGIYTQLFAINQAIDYQVLYPVGVKITENTALHEKITDLSVLPYFFNDIRYDGKAILCEGQCVAWKYEGN